MCVMRNHTSFQALSTVSTAMDTLSGAKLQGKSLGILLSGDESDITHTLT